MVLIDRFIHIPDPYVLTGQEEENFEVQEEDSVVTGQEEENFEVQEKVDTIVRDVVIEEA
jgi:hypothetical protein